MDIEKVRQYCLSKMAVTESFPFDDVTPVYKVVNKMFCLINIDPPYSMNLKCDPEKAIELREEYEQVQPGYHMNKIHWNTIYFEGKAKDEDILEWIDNSYNLVIKTFSKKEKELYKKETKNG